MTILVRLFDRLMEVVAAILILALLITVTLGIVTREFGEPLIWTDEVSRFLMLWVAVVGWILASRKRAHIRIRFFHDLLPTRAWRAAETVMQLAMAVLGALIMFYSVHLVSANWDLEATTVPVSMGLLYVPMLLAGLVTLVQGLVETVDNLRHWNIPPGEADGADMPLPEIVK